MRSFSRLIVLGLVVSLFLALAPLAQADNQRASSEPNGDIFVTSSSGALSDRDKDGDFNTLTQADRGTLFYAVANQTQEAQTVHVMVVLDGPGTAQDATLVDKDIVIGPNDIDQVPFGFEFKVRSKDWPAGTYSLSVSGSGSESVTVVSTFTVAYNK